MFPKLGVRVSVQSGWVHNCITADQAGRVTKHPEVFVFGNQALLQQTPFPDDQTTHFEVCLMCQSL
jgi:hypothetical protein